MLESSSIPYQFSSRIAPNATSLSIFGVLLLIVLFPLTLMAQRSETVVAKVGGEEITQAEVDDTVSSQIYALDQQLFNLRKAALNNLIGRKIIEREAARQKLAVDQLKSKWMAGEVTIDQAQVTDLYQKNLPAFGLMNPEEAKEKLRLDLEAQSRLKRFREELSALREKTTVEILLEEPRLRVTKSRDLRASKGPADAKVVITEFSDFQCPYCKEVQATLRKVLEAHSSDVRLDFRNLPLEGHPFALTAARSAHCGGKQGAFWKFHDALFESVEPSSEKVLGIAQKLGLNVSAFKSCLESPETESAIGADLKEAQRLGLDGTPSFIINGKLLLGVASFEEFNNAILRELKKLTAQELGSSTSRK
ncbi:MAG TPA: thioredoxin domain-containing protein [Pyrinomonadaceae bacterium]